MTTAPVTLVRGTLDVTDMRRRSRTLEDALVRNVLEDDQRGYLTVNWVGIALVKLTRGTLGVMDALRSLETLSAMVACQFLIFLGVGEAYHILGVIHWVALFCTTLYIQQYVSDSNNSSVCC